MRQLKTYIIEDSPVIRQSLIETLEELVPVKVVGVAEDELTALRWLTDACNSVDLVIVDLFLKSGSGLGVLRSIRPSQLPCKIVVLSNYATKDIRQKCLELGAHQVFDKSTEIESLIEYCGDLADGQAESSAL
jgi:DNA-binding NarL/FixJ family response regulator